MGGEFKLFGKYVLGGKSYSMLVVFGGFMYFCIELYFVLVGVGE